MLGKRHCLGKSSIEKNQSANFSFIFLKAHTRIRLQAKFGEIRRELIVLCIALSFLKKTTWYYSDCEASGSLSNHRYDRFMVFFDQKIHFLVSHPDLTIHVKIIAKRVLEIPKSYHYNIKMLRMDHHAYVSVIVSNY